MEGYIVKNAMWHHHKSTCAEAIFNWPHQQIIEHTQMLTRSSCEFREIIVKRFCTMLQCTELKMKLPECFFYSIFGCGKAYDFDPFARNHKCQQLTIQTEVFHQGS